jgi:Fur family peroxide stress response transcriptional regulator
LTTFDITVKLKEHGIRLTPQRLAVAEVVMNSADHPTAREIYGRVGDFFPYLTLATVYSTLSILEKAGLVAQLPFPKESRYDSNNSPHVNLVCQKCQSIIDCESGDIYLDQIKKMITKSCLFQIKYQRFDLYGLCEHCGLK